MMKIVLIFCFLWPVVLSAQLYDKLPLWKATFDDNDSLKSCVVGQYSNFIASDVFTSSFMKSVFDSDYLSDEMKLKNKVSSMNHFGYEQRAYTGFFRVYDSLLGYKNVGISAGVEYNSYVTARFTGDAYNLVFFGNKSFAGKTAILTGTQINSMTCQKIKLGISKNEVINETNTSLFLGLNFIKGQNYLSAYIDTTELYTSDTGDEIKLMSAFQFWASDTNITNFAAFNGWGLSADLAFRVYNPDNGFEAFLSVENIGAVKWNKKSIKLNIDTTIDYTGAEVNLFFDDAESSIDGAIDRDSITDLYYSNLRRVSFLQVLQNKFNIFAAKNFKSLKLFAGMESYLNAGQLMPMFYGGGKYELKNFISFTISASYGGFTRFQTAASIGARFTKNLSVNVGAPNVLGYLLPDKTYSKGVFCNLFYQF